MAVSASLLLVDDDAITREVLRAVLESDNWTVHDAEDGAAALAWICGHGAPDAILCDLNMPGECGAPLARAMRRALPTGADPLIVAMSGTPHEVPPAGFEVLLVKPFEPRDLRRLLEDRNARRAPSLRNETGQAVRELKAARTDFEVLDQAVLHRLQESMGQAQVLTLVRFGMQDARERLIRMQTCADKGDDAGFRQQAHALKGGCAMVGARRLWAMAAVAEAQGLAAGYRADSPSAACLRDFSEEVEKVELMLLKL